MGVFNGILMDVHGIFMEFTWISMEFHGICFVDFKAKMLV